MSIWIISLVVAALGAMCACLNDLRALLWIACGVASFAATTAWQQAQMPYYPAACGLVDAFQCLLIYHLGRYRWEMLLWRVWQTSLLISIGRFLGLVGSPNLYVAGLEACNWAALAVIVSSRFAAGLADELARDWSWVGLVIHRALLSLRDKRSTPPWHLTGA